MHSPFKKYSKFPYFNVSTVVFLLNSVPGLIFPTLTTTPASFFQSRLFKNLYPSAPIRYQIILAAHNPHSQVISVILNTVSLTLGIYIVGNNARQPPTTDMNKGLFSRRSILKIDRRECFISKAWRRMRTVREANTAALAR